VHFRNAEADVRRHRDQRPIRRRQWRGDLPPHAAGPVRRCDRQGGRGRHCPACPQGNPPHAGPRMSLSPTERAEQLLAMTRRLIDLISAEIAALDAKRLDGASADWEEKERLAHSWRLEVAHVKANPSALAGIGEPMKAALRESSRELEDKLS